MGFDFYTRRMRRAAFHLVSMWFILFFVRLNCKTHKNPRPNIVVILIDDLDYVLAGLEPMAITRRLVSQHGATFTNAVSWKHPSPIAFAFHPHEPSFLTCLRMQLEEGRACYSFRAVVVKNMDRKYFICFLFFCFVFVLWNGRTQLQFISTPVCCPSRSSILTGKYVHNHRVINNTVTGNCSSPQWQNGEELKTMATYLQSNGYATFYGGKYLNQAREALSFIDGVVPNRHPSSLSAAADSRPFFAMIAPPACHAPFTPAPQFSRSFAGRRAPRWPSFNRHPGNDKHWLLRQAPQGALPEDIIDQVDHVFRQRWRTLLSVDQMVGDIVKLLRRKGQLDRTWIVVTSDHGYHMGQFAMPIDKRLPYETDIRVPLLVVAASHNRPPANNKSRDIEIDSLSVVSIDLAPTVLHMAGLPIPDDMDGVSLLPLVTNALTPSSQNRNVSKVSQVAEPWDRHCRGIDDSSEPWRTFFLIEYHGEADLQDVDLQCQQDANTTLCLNDFGCKCQDAANNTYVCLRTLRPTGNQHANEDSLYCQFDDLQAFVESYDLRLDPYQLNNRAYRRSCRCTVASRHRRQLIVNYSKCRGHVNCFGVSDNPKRRRHP
ncbi:N-acetylglucosamine-6-sulfatase-like isoform X3 [Daphnia magna]|uniref:N-acetylglucosamine-6-sulfatase-like isoform X3 n=1 Tax=Daphnia magna TaxID=35525 RepID=UPI001E1BAE76|nr:N-acetylglucosamine-6-sulfatase-like isoform X3 [Daphnia magna]